MLPFFGVLTALDCTDDLLVVGLTGFILGAMLGFVVSYLLRRLATY